MSGSLNDRIARALRAPRTSACVSQAIPLGGGGRVLKLMLCRLPCEKCSRVRALPSYEPQDD